MSAVQRFSRSKMPNPPSCSITIVRYPQRSTRLAASQPPDIPDGMSIVSSNRSYGVTSSDQLSFSDAIELLDEHNFHECNESQQGPPSPPELHEIQTRLQNGRRIATRRQPLRSLFGRCFSWVQRRSLGVEELGEGEGWRVPSIDSGRSIETGECNAFGLVLLRTC
jgi:hypothetical protein